MLNAKTLVMIPTYNEKDNVSLLYKELRKLGSEFHILFVDDNSPDGTGEIVRELINQDSALHLLSREKKNGIGSAHDEGIGYAYDNGYEILVTMDCDFTHSPLDVPTLISHLKTSPIVVASRFLKEKSLKEWNLFRKFLTKLGHFFTVNLLDVKEDATGAFRVYDLKKIPRGIFKLVRSKGYSFFFESLFILKRNQFSIYEVGIDLPARTYGHSKMNVKDVFKSLRFLVELCFLNWLYPETFFFDESFDGNFEWNKNAVDNQGWDEYWASKTTSSNLVYDLIAAFYRKFIIKRNLNYFIKSNFNSTDIVLHAGCGSGQVDTDLTKLYKIKALDISKEALKMYKKVNKLPESSLIHGSIFQIPMSENSVNGIYNLGVMEHFEKEEIKKILNEFNRVLKKEGKVVLFWPPEFGLSVIFLKMVHWFFKNILKSNKKFHPDEISRIQSRTQVRNFLEEANFKLEKYTFSIRDLFTYVIVVASKA